MKIKSNDFKILESVQGIAANIDESQDFNVEDFKNVQDFKMKWCVQMAMFNNYNVTMRAFGRHSFFIAKNMDAFRNPRLPQINTNDVKFLTFVLVEENVVVTVDVQSVARPVHGKNNVYIVKEKDYVGDKTSILRKIKNMINLITEEDSTLSYFEYLYVDVYRDKIVKEGEDMNKELIKMAFWCFAKRSPFFLDSQMLKDHDNLDVLYTFLYRNYRDMTKVDEIASTLAKLTVPFDRIPSDKKYLEAPTLSVNAAALNNTFVTDHSEYAKSSQRINVRHDNEAIRSKATARMYASENMHSTARNSHNSLKNKPTPSNHWNDLETDMTIQQARRYAMTVIETGKAYDGGESSMSHGLCHTSCVKCSSAHMRRLLQLANKANDSSMEYTKMLVRLQTARFIQKSEKMRCHPMSCKIIDDISKDAYALQGAMMSAARRRRSTRGSRRSTQRRARPRRGRSSRRRRRPTPQPSRQRPKPLPKPPGKRTGKQPSSGGAKTKTKPTDSTKKAKDKTPSTTPKKTTDRGTSTKKKTDGSGKTTAKKDGKPDAKDKSTKKDGQDTKKKTDTSDKSTAKKDGKPDAKDKSTKKDGQDTKKKTDTSDKPTAKKDGKPDSKDATDKTKTKKDGKEDQKPSTKEKGKDGTDKTKTGKDGKDSEDSTSDKSKTKKKTDEGDGGDTRKTSKERKTERKEREKQLKEDKKERKLAEKERKEQEKQEKQDAGGGAGDGPGGGGADLPGGGMDIPATSGPLPPVPPEPLGQEPLPPPLPPGSVGQGPLPPGSNGAALPPPTEDTGTKPDVQEKQKELEERVTYLESERTPAEVGDGFEEMSLDDDEYLEDVNDDSMDMFSQSVQSSSNVRSQSNIFDKLAKSFDLF